MRKNNKFVENNIFKSAENINLNQVMGYIKNNKKTIYLEEYDK